MPDSILLFDIYVLITSFKEQETISVTPIWQPGPCTQLPPKIILKYSWKRHDTLCSDTCDEMGIND